MKFRDALTDPVFGVALSNEADRLISDVAKRDVESYRRALELMADLELESRGGGGGVLSEDTAAVRAVIAAAR